MFAIIRKLINGNLQFGCFEIIWNLFRFTAVVFAWRGNPERCNREILDQELEQNALLI